MKKLSVSLLFLTLCVILSNLVLAEESGSILVGKQNDCINLPQECSSCSYVNLTTITLSNMTSMVIQSPMSKSGTSYNYTFCNTNSLGSYVYCMVGDVDNVATSVCKDFEITVSGEKIDISKALLYVVLLAVLIILALLSVSKISSSSNYGWGLAFICSTYILTIAVLFIAWQIADSFLASISFLNTILYFLWLLSMICFFPFTLVLFIYMFSKLAGEREIKKLMEMGYSKEESEKMKGR